MVQENNIYCAFLAVSSKPLFVPIILPQLIANDIGYRPFLISTEYVIFTQWRQILSIFLLNYFQFRLLSQPY